MLNNVQIDLGASNSLLKSEGELERLKLASATTSAFGTKQTFRGSVPMSAFGGKADIPICSAYSPETVGGNSVIRRAPRLKVT